MKTKNIVRLFLVLSIAVVGLSCQMGSKNKMKLVNYADPASPEKANQQFHHAVFTEGSLGAYELLLQTKEPFTHDGRQILRQTVFVRTLWTPLPGRTYAEATQMNANLVYLVEIADHPDATVRRERPTVLCYKGTGFVYFRTNRSGDTLTGQIESALMKPVDADADRQLGTFKLTGTFQAKKDREAVADFKLTSGSLLR